MLHWVGSGLTCKHQTIMKRPARVKHSSLLAISYEKDKGKVCEYSPRLGIHKTTKEYRKNNNLVIKRFMRIMQP